ncbi:MAG: Ig-like domain-containing protein, partial [Candidatus Bipolaricaulia bacterium]
MTRWITAMLGFLLVAIAGGAAYGQYPDCGFGCSANDVNVVEAYVDAPETCVPGDLLTAGLYVTFLNGTNSNRYAVRLLGELYVGGRFEQSLDECVIDTMPPGSTTVLLSTVSWTCGESLEFLIVTVSWSANRETCGDTPSCAERKAKCWFAPVIAIEELPVSVDFTSTAPVCHGETVHFTDLTNGGDTPYSYEWDFGDGGSSRLPNPSYTYSGPGTYVVTITVTDSRGITNSTSSVVTVDPNPDATATSGGPYCLGDTIELSASGGVIYSWTGPNGFSSSLQNPPIPNASAANAGAYTVVVSNVYGCTDQASTLVEMDATSPILTRPSDATVECGDSTEPAQTGQATATDDTDPASTVTYSDVSDLSGCGETGAITRTWTATDACGNTASGTQTITVVDTTTPVLQISSASFECDGAGNVTDVSDWLSSAVATDTCGAVTVTNDYAGLTETCPGVGSASVTFTATDACGNVTTRMATLTIADATPPGAIDDAATTDEGVDILIDVLANDSDVCDPAVALVAAGSPAFGTTEIVAGQVRYTPPAGFDGSDSFSYTIEDCSGNAASTLVEVTVLPVNDPPAANDQTATAQEDTPLPFTVTATDRDGDALTYSIVGGPSNGTISGFDPATGELTYTPDADYDGPDSFTFVACDPSGACDTGVVTITVEAGDDPPVADPQTVTTPEDTPLPITVTATDPDGDTLTYSIVGGPSNGTISGFDPATGQL